ncbi:MAG: hypothetical protein WC548_01420 [Candidatus Pacearchaeota archaeon]
MEVKDVEKVERIRGIAATVKAEDFRVQYTEGVKKFLYDHQEFGDDWVKRTASQLYVHKKNQEGDVRESNVPAGVAISTFTDIPLIGGKQLLEIYRQNGDKNPFGNVYIDFGVHFNGRPERNLKQTSYLLSELSHRGIRIQEGVIDFGKLRLDINEDEGGLLVYKLAEDFEEGDIVPVSTYPFISVSKNGLFRAYLDRSYWIADDDDLANSNDDGLVVRYDAEGVALKKPTKKQDLIEITTADFLKRL